MESPHPEWMETLGAEEGKEPAGVALLASQTDKKKADLLQTVECESV